MGPDQTVEIMRRVLIEAMIRSASKGVDDCFWNSQRTTRQPVAQGTGAVSRCDPKRSIPRLIRCQEAAADRAFCSTRVRLTEGGGS